jgi:hypothetical protein
MITVAVEGDTDVPIAKKLCGCVGLAVVEPIVASGGIGELDKMIPGFAHAARHAPHWILRDLDRAEDCAPIWMAKHAPRAAGPLFSLRLAVRAVEAWILADTNAVAAALGVPARRLPVAPDDERDPKVTLVNLARQSTKATIRKGLVPAPGVKRKAGAAYEAWLIEFGLTTWSVERALPRSPSLTKAHQALVRLEAQSRKIAAGDLEP